MTTKSTRNRDDLLKALLLPIFEEWGPDAIRRCVAGLEERSTGTERINAQRPNARQGKRSKPTAVDLATRSDPPEARKASLLRLALLFDQKQFLPTASDVRHFLELRGQHTGVIKQRHDSFRKVLHALEGMPDHELERLLNSSVHSGPTQLGPLSDAIRAVSASRSTSTNPQSGASTDPHKPSAPDSVSRTGSHDPSE